VAAGVCVSALLLNEMTADVIRHRWRAWNWEDGYGTCSGEGAEAESRRRSESSWLDIQRVLIYRS